MLDRHQTPSAQRRRIWEVIIVFLAGGIGGILRFGLGSWLPAMPGRLIPTSFVINSIGCFVIGLVTELATSSHRRTLSSDQSRGVPRPILFATGFSGGFTTIAALTPESIRIFESGDQGRAAIYALGSLLLANACLAIGVRVGRRNRRTTSTVAA